MMEMDEWRERANRRRDERHTLSPNVRPPGGSKKNTRRWCRGKVGVEHKPVVKGYGEAKHLAGDWANFEWEIVVCERCGKHLKFQRRANGQ